MSDDNVTKLVPKQPKESVMAGWLTMPDRVWEDTGPYTVTVSDRYGKMFEVTFPDYLGVLPPNAPVRGTVGEQHVLANLLSGAIHVVRVP